MGKKGREVVELDVDELIKDLNAAVADEWNAFYQYWICALMAEGVDAPTVAEELMEHGKEELEHAEELVNRILELEGRPLDNPKKIKDFSLCGYIDPPKDPRNLKAMLTAALKGEACAIEYYTKLANKTLGKDHATYMLMLDLIKDEVEHEEEFEDLAADL